MGTVHDHGELKMDEHYRAIFRIFLFQTLGQFIISLPLTLLCPGPELRLIKAPNVPCSWENRMSN